MERQNSPRYHDRVHQVADLRGRMRVRSRPIIYGRRADFAIPGPKVFNDVKVPMPKTLKLSRAATHDPQWAVNLPPGQDNLVLAKSSQSTESHAPTRPKSVHRYFMPAVLASMAAVIFTIGIIVSVSGWHSNAQAASQIKKLSHAAASTDNSGSNPSTASVSPQTISSYSVAPAFPRYLDIPALGVHARIRSLGVTGTNQLQAPSNVYDTGWYNQSSLPGQPGAMLVDGHISSWTTHGVFYGLDKLSAGDKLSITRGDGQVFNYQVSKTAIVNSDNVDMASLMVSADPAKPGLNLISCAGSVIPGSSEFNKRITIYAVQI